MLDYFQYEQIIETSPVDVRANMRNGKSYILAAQPHGVVSLCGICSAIYADKEFQGTIPTGVASAVLNTPILKHVMGIFYLISASKSSLKKQFKKGGIEGTVVLYVGGMAELFLSSVTEETLYLKKRKGFIKLALQEGVDVVPIYFFGNTTILSVIKTGLLANLSRRLQISLTYFWGKWLLPIPRDEKVSATINFSRIGGVVCKGP
jgi:2-acylglycerol O-acyltransferase 2